MSRTDGTSGDQEDQNQMNQRQIARPPGLPAPIPIPPVEVPITAPPTPPPPTGTLDELLRILDTLRAVNDIRDEVIKLGLNPSLKLAIDTEIAPVVNVLQALSVAVNFYATAAFNLHNNSFAKAHEIKKILNLVYDTAEVSEDVLEVLRKLIYYTLPKSPY